MKDIKAKSFIAELWEKEEGQIPRARRLKRLVSVRMTDNCQPSKIQQRSIFRHDVGADSIMIWLSKIKRHPACRVSKKIYIK